MEGVKIFPASRCTKAGVELGSFGDYLDACKRAHDIDFVRSFRMALCVFM